MWLRECEGERESEKEFGIYYFIYNWIKFILGKLVLFNFIVVNFYLNLLHCSLEMREVECVLSMTFNFWNLFHCSEEHFGKFVHCIFLLLRGKLRWRIIFQFLLKHSTLHCLRKIRIYQRKSFSFRSTQTCVKLAVIGIRLEIKYFQWNETSNFYCTNTHTDISLYGVIHIKTAQNENNILWLSFKTIEKQIHCVR